MPGRNSARGAPSGLNRRERVMQELQQVPTNRDPFTKEDFTLSEGTPDERSLVATVELNRPFAIREGRPFDLSLVAYESFTSDGTADNSETFGVSHDLVDSEAVADSVVVYVDGTGYVEPDSIDYTNNEVEVTDPGTDNEVAVFYSAGDQTRIEIEKEAPNGTVESLWSDDLGMVHRRDLNRQPLTFDFSLSRLQPIVPTDYNLNVYVDAPYRVAFEPEVNGTEREATNALLDVPAKGAVRDIDGLAAEVRHDMARR